jgi:hypothetical protein
MAKVRIKMPPAVGMAKAARKISRGFRAACVWCGHGYRKYAREIEHAHLQNCEPYQAAKSRVQ